ncbi:hypothetical protein G5I_14167 [Acromyrmex echinatior]|uniref:Osiris 16 n=1 Tax=Acromyrmex echinatior TaxID=103372 RepID=F4X730_ACREC|nr:hypothetical protein G5I_14167 [Acromyrmex echinatior]
MKGITHVVQLSRCHLLLLVLFLSGCANAEIERRTTRQLIEDAPENLASNLNKENCGKSYSATCLKLDVVSFLDKLSEQENIGILPGVSVIKENGSADVPASEVVANLARDFPNDVEKRLDAYLVHKVGSYLNSHSISIKLFDPKTFEATRSFNEEALAQLGLGGNQNVETGRKKDKGGYGGLLAGLMMMKGTLGAIGFGALALLAGKALMTGLMALMLSAIIGLKSLAGGGDKKTTYEIVSKPVYSSSHTHSSEEHHGHGYGHSGYGRSLDIVHDSLQQAVLKYGNAHDLSASISPKLIFVVIAIGIDINVYFLSCKSAKSMLIFYLLITCVIHVNTYEKNEIRNVKDYIFDTTLHRIPVERQIFNFKKNGIKIDLKIVPSAKNDSVKNKNDDYFPEFPVKDIGKCIIKFSLDCIKKRFIRFIETVGRLDEITLLGQDVKLVKTRVTRRSNARSMNDSDVSIERSVDDFFDSFTLRIMLPRWNNKQEKNQIDMMFDETAVAEGRGKKGGGCGGGKGGKCKMMMMGMMMMLKMKLIGNVIIFVRIYFLLLVQTYFYDIKIFAYIYTQF